MAAVDATTAAREPWTGKRLAVLRKAELDPTAKERVNERGRILLRDKNNNDRGIMFMRHRRPSGVYTREERIQTAIRTADDVARGEYTELTLSGIGLTDITDIPGVFSALANVKKIDCRYNLITDLPNLRVMAPNLEVLWCVGNQLTSLPPLPDSLVELWCSNNLLRRLPRPLPPRLVTLSCDDNQLIYLPSLPTTLKRLQCGNNQLRELPQLPEGLTELSCHDNKLTFLPKLPSSPNFNLVIYNNPFKEPLTPYGKTKQFFSRSETDSFVTFVNNYLEYQTVETLGQEMVNPKSHLSAGTGQPGRVGYGFNSGPDANILGFLGIREGKEGFNEARARIRTKVNPNPLAAVNTNLFKGGKRHRKTKRSKKSRRHKTCRSTGSRI